MQRQTTAGEQGSRTALKRLMAALPLVFASAISLVYGDRIAPGNWRARTVLGVHRPSHLADSTGLLQVGKSRAIGVQWTAS